VVWMKESFGKRRLRLLISSTVAAGSFRHSGLSAPVIRIAGRTHQALTLRHACPGLNNCQLSGMLLVFTPRCTASSAPLSFDQSRCIPSQRPKLNGQRRRRLSLLQTLMELTNWFLVAGMRNTSASKHANPCTFQGLVAWLSSTKL
jgi:hypothetical protein